MSFSNVSRFLVILSVLFSNFVYSQNYPHGPVVKLQAFSGSGSVDQLMSIRVAAYNVLNLMESQKDPNQKKSKNQLLATAKTILETAPQILQLEEVENIRVLDFFNREYLKNQYQPLLIEGNDERGIDVGYLIRKDMPFDVVAYSHKNVKAPYLGQNTTVFSRDLPVLLFYPKNTNSKPLFAIAGTHFKSMRDTDGDPLSTQRRSLQAFTASKIIEAFEKNFQNQLPLILMGDFNNDVTLAPEFEPLRKMGMRDAFDLVSPPLKQNQRITHSYFPPKGGADYKQVDAIWMNRTLQSKNALLRAGVIQYKDQQGRLIPLPRSFQERQKLPSDHYMIAADLSIKKL